ncbi:MAG: radical SAM protein, partial [Planctomycetota bacterium]
MHTRSAIAGLRADELAAIAAAELLRGAGRARELYRLAMRSGRFDPQAVEMGATARAAWRERFHFDLPVVDHVVSEPCPEAPGQSTAKAVLRAADGHCFESVHLPMGRGRHTLCVSTQVGCRMGCAFCQTARMGLRRQLTAAEIVGQVLVARHVLGWPIRNVVFMGMGEPLDNWDQLRQALLVLTERSGCTFAHDRLTVCTVGQAAGIRRLATLGWKRLGLSISLNAADDALRARLMPATRGTALAQL